MRGLVSILLSIMIVMRTVRPRLSLRTNNIFSAVRFLKRAKQQSLFSTAEHRGLENSTNSTHISARNITHVERLDALLGWSAPDFVAAERARRVIVLEDALQGMGAMGCVNLSMEAEDAAQKLRAMLAADVEDGSVEPLLGGDPRDLDCYCGAMLRYVLHTFSIRGTVPADFVRELLDQSVDLLRSLPNVVEVRRSRMGSSGYGAMAARGGDTNRSDAEMAKADEEVLGSITVVGDVHGQFDDFAAIFDEEVAGAPHAENQFVFNGDLVDRGAMGSEIVLTVLLAKVLSSAVASARAQWGSAHEDSFSGAVHILRGNHETTAMNENYGFAAEVRQKYDQPILDQFRSVFEALPVAAVLEGEPPYTVCIMHSCMCVLLASSLTALCFNLPLSHLSISISLSLSHAHTHTHTHAHTHTHTHTRTHAHTSSPLPLQTRCSSFTAVWARSQRR
jgi:hypothetical protein